MKGWSVEAGKNGSNDNRAVMNETQPRKKKTRSLPAPQEK
jgi:hypothetical protein